MTRYDYTIIIDYQQIELKHYTRRMLLDYVAGRSCQILTSIKVK